MSAENRSQKYYQQFGDKSDTDVPGRKLGGALDPTEAMFSQTIQKGRAYAESRGEAFSPSRFMYRRLLMMSGDALFPQGINLQEQDGSEEASNLFKKMAVSYGILSYSQWPLQQQRGFREALQTTYYGNLCDEAEQDEQRDEDHDHSITLPEQARQLLKHITNVTAIAYTPEQTTFRFSSVLNRAEPIEN